ncbi:hypothetical protein [Stackebrandtia soli]|uniref:hypothetical protein n=1 Tax=Stackebrandtia soli TaxID=1892856 RepID=UPI0039EB1F71
MSYQTPPQMTTPYQKQQIDIAAGTAFKVGFFGAFGAMCAALIISIFFAILGLLLGASMFQMLTGV